MKKTSFSRSVLAILLATGGGAYGGSTDISQTPLVTPGTSSVKPNVYFIMDNSGSMERNFAPEFVNDNYCKSQTNYTTATLSTSDCSSSTSDVIPVDALLLKTHYFNGIYYNPAITYTAPYKYDGTQWPTPSGFGSVYTSSNPFVTSPSTGSISTTFPDIKWCASANPTDCVINDNYILPAKIGSVTYDTPTSITSGSFKMVSGSLNNPSVAATSTTIVPHYYVPVPGEYCKTKKLTDCATMNQPNSTYPFPAVVRWCKNNDLTSCQATKTATYQYIRYPTVVLTRSAGTTAAQATGAINIGNVPKGTATATTDGACGADTTKKVTITSLKLAGTEMLSSTPLVYCNSSNTQSTRNTGLASYLDDFIAANGFSKTTTNTNPIGVKAPAGLSFNTANGATLSATIAAGSGATITVSTNFTGGQDTTAASITAVPGSWKRINIASGSTFGNLYANSDGSVSTTATTATLLDRSSRSDCASAPNCTFAEEEKNFSIWYSYYRTRRNMMKSALSIAFQGVDNRYRVGYFTINSASTNLVNMSEFTSGATGHKKSWFDKMFATTGSSSTPLRTALAMAGQLYAGKQGIITGSTDPVLYACQKNFTILSTDGYWNSDTGGKDKNNSATIGDSDGDGYVGTLADVAHYYYQTGSHLRIADTNYSDSTYTGLLTQGLVPSTTSDPNRNQHMTTYTISLGIDGMMQYRSNYEDAPSSTETPDDYTSVQTAATVNTTTGVCTWKTSGTCKWPDPDTGNVSNETEARIDDLWHAAVNGHGRYYSARDPLSLNRGLSDALSSIATQIGGAAAATTSNPNVTTGDNFVFSSNYMTSEWTGELVRQTIDLDTGDVNSSIDWSAQGKLDAKAYALRSILTFSSTDTGYKKSFEWGNLTAPEQAYFNTPAISSLSQMCTIGASCLSASDKTLVPGESLVNFLRGDRTNEETSTGGIYRKREHVLGDIVSAEAAYGGKYLFDYSKTDSSYPTKGTERSNPSVFVAANDGMVHAFNATNGEERWAYIPSMVMPRLYHLADKNYMNLHEYFVDGTPILGDVKSSGWKTILVGGLAGGGQGYYALDVTDQSNPKVLWEFRQGSVCNTGATTASGGVISDCELGQSFGNPVITKLSNGTWVVMIASGYNNTSNGGTGKGYLFILDAISGNLLYKVSTGVGDTTTPSGLSKIAAWADNPMLDNTAKYVYGGDLLGNMWRFDLTGGTPTVTLVINVGKPITAKPALGKVTLSNGSTTKRVVFFPTGRLLGLTDMSDNSQQSFYGIWDSGSTSGTLKQSTITSTSSGRTGNVIASVFEDDANKGWYLNFPDTGERGNTDPGLAFGTLVFTTNKPSTSDACNPSGFTSWLYNIDYLSGGAIQTDDDTTTSGLPVATKYSGASTRPNIVVLPNGQVKSITRTSGGTVQNNVADVRTKSAGGTLKRVSWRELVR